MLYVIHAPSYLNSRIRARSCSCWEEWLWERFYFRSHSRLRCLRLLPLRRRRQPASCAKLSDRARLVTVAPTLSPMPNGELLSGASGTAEFASSAIAFRRIDYWLKTRRNASARGSPRAPGMRARVRQTLRRDHASALGPHQPGRYSASSLLARRSARSIAAEKSASTAFLLILRRKKSAHRNSLNGVVSLAKPPARR